jgi:hypothetical protein
VNGFDHGAGVFGFNAGVNAVSQVEDVSITITEAGQNPADLFTNMLR